MTYVVTESCIKCKYTDCVDVCPVDCFREGPNMLVIDPDECIDCTLCVAECPVEAIFAEDDVPDDQKEFTALNAELAKVWKPIIEKKDAPADADEWAKVKDKKHLLEKCGRRWAAPASRGVLRGRIPAELGRVAGRKRGPFGGSDPADAHRIGISTTRLRSASTVASRKRAPAPRSPIPAPRFTRIRLRVGESQEKKHLIEKCARS